MNLDNCTSLNDLYQEAEAAGVKSNIIHATFKKNNPCEGGNNNKRNYKGNNRGTQQKKSKTVPKSQVSQLRNTKTKDPGEEDLGGNDGYHKELEKVNQMAVGLGSGLLHNTQSNNKNSMLSYSFKFRRSRG